MSAFATGLATNIGLIGQGLTSAIGTYSDYQVSKTQYEMDKMAKAHNEYMRTVAYANQVNTMAEADIDLHEETQRAAFALGVTSKQDKAAAEVAAAAAGVAGGSVEGTSRRLEQSFLRAHQARKTQERMLRRGLRTNRYNAEMAHVFGQDVSTLTKPSASTAMLGLATQLIGQYDKAQPKGYKTADHLSNLFRSI